MAWKKYKRPHGPRQYITNEIATVHNTFEDIGNDVVDKIDQTWNLPPGTGKRSFDNYWDNDALLHRTPKKPKLIKLGKKKGRYQAMYRRRRFFSKKRSSRSRGKKSLVRLIKQVSREPKRSVVASGGPGISAANQDEGVPTELNIIQASLGPFTSQYGNQAVGNQYFLRGLKIKFYAYNPSNLPFTCVVSILTTKIQSGPRPALTNGQAIFYNPCAGNIGIPVARSSMSGTPLHFATPKIHPQGPYRELKRFVFTLASTTRNEGTVDPNELDIEPSPNHADLKRWNMWLPINKEVKQNAGDTTLTNAGMPIRLCFWCTPAMYDVPLLGNVDPTKNPKLMFESILYYRD